MDSRDPSRGSGVAHPYRVRGDIRMRLTAWILCGGLPAVAVRLAGTWSCSKCGKECFKQGVVTV